MQRAVYEVCEEDINVPLYHNHKEPRSIDILKNGGESCEQYEPMPHTTNRNNQTAESDTQNNYLEPIDREVEDCKDRLIYETPEHNLVKSHDDHKTKQHEYSIIPDNPNSKSNGEGEKQGDSHYYSTIS